MCVLSGGGRGELIFPTQVRIYSVTTTGLVYRSQTSHNVVDSLVNFPYKTFSRHPPKSGGYSVGAGHSATIISRSVGVVLTC